jgi:TRAP transporter TAXI family solute receptor
MTLVRPVAFIILAAAVLAVAAGVVLVRATVPDRTVLRLTAGTAGGTYAAFADALAASWTVDKRPQLAVLRSAGADANARRLSNGQADIGLIQSDTTVTPDTLVVARLFPEAFHLVARSEAGIAGVNDLRGRTVGLLPEGAGSNALFERLLRHHEIAPDEIDVVHGHLPALEKAIASGAVDAFFIVVALGNDTIARIIKSAPTRLVPIAQAEAMAMFDPALSAAVVPVGTYSGQRPVPARPTTVVVVHSLLAVRRDLPEARVEALTRALFERRQDMARTLPQAAFIAAPSHEDRLAFGVHPGAQAYYAQDEPVFVVEYAEPLALGVTALALLVSGAWQARVWRAGARKNRADRYNLEIIDIIARIEAATRDDELETIRRDLFEIFRKVLSDLDNDRIEEKSLLSFSFAWQVAASTLNHRQLVGASGPSDAVRGGPAMRDGAPV